MSFFAGCQSGVSRPLEVFEFQEFRWFQRFGAQQNPWSRTSTPSCGSKLPGMELADPHVIAKICDRGRASQRGVKLWLIFCRVLDLTCISRFLKAYFDEPCCLSFFDLNMLISMFQIWNDSTILEMGKWSTMVLSVCGIWECRSQLWTKFLASLEEMVGDVQHSWWFYGTCQKVNLKSPSHFWSISCSVCWTRCKMPLPKAWTSDPYPHGKTSLRVRRNQATCALVKHLEGFCIFWSCLANPMYVWYCMTLCIHIIYNYNQEYMFYVVLYISGCIVSEPYIK